MQVVRNKGQNSYRQSRSSNHNPPEGSSLAQSPSVHPPGKCRRKLKAQAEGVWRVEVPGRQISRFIAFRNLWDFWTPVNLHNWSQRHKGCPGPLLITTVQPGKLFGSKYPPALQIPLHVCISLFHSPEAHSKSILSLFLSIYIYLSIYLSIFSIFICIN